MDTISTSAHAGISNNQGQSIQTPTDRILHRRTPKKDPPFLATAIQYIYIHILYNVFVYTYIYIFGIYTLLSLHLFSARSYARRPPSATLDLASMLASALPKGVNIHTYVHTHIYIYTHICIFKYEYIYIYYTHTYTYAYVYTYV